MCVNLHCLFERWRVCGFLPQTRWEHPVVCFEILNKVRVRRGAEHSNQRITQVAAAMGSLVFMEFNSD